MNIPCSRFVYLILLSVILCYAATASVDDLNQKTHSSQTSYSDSSSDSGSSNDAGGYKKDRQVIDQKYEFSKKRFTKEDLGAWLDLFCLAKSADYFIQLQEEQHIKRTGEVVRYPLVLLDKEYQPGQIIDLEDIRPVFEEQYTGAKLIRELISANVLDESGYIVSANSLPVDFSKIDFSYLFPKICQINFKANDSNLNDALLRDLYNLIVNENRLVVVKQRETTTYQSTQKGFLEQLGDFIVGNAVGSVLFPDKIQVSKYQEQWIPNTPVLDYYNFKPGFNQYPFYGNKGLLVLNGKRALTTFEMTGIRTDDLKKYSLNLNSKYLIPANHSTNVVAGAYGTVGVDFNQFYDETSALGFTSLYLGGGSVVASTQTNMIFGLAYKNSRSYNGVGFMVGGDFVWYMFNPLGLEFGLRNYWQPNFIQKVNTWQLLQYQVALNCTFSALTGKIGYQWNSSGSSTLLNSTYVAAGMYF